MKTPAMTRFWTTSRRARAGERDDGGDGGELVADDDRVGGLQGEVGARPAHGDAGVGGGQRGGVVDAVPDDQHLAARRPPAPARRPPCPAGSSPARTSVMPDLGGQPGGGARVVAGEQHGRGAGERGERGDGGGGVRAQPVGEAEHPDGHAVDDDQDGGTAAPPVASATPAGVGSASGPSSSRAGAPDRDRAPVDGRGHARARARRRSPRASGDAQPALARRVHHGAGQRMLAGVLGRGRQRQQRVLVQPGAGQRPYVGHPRACPR